MGEEITYQEENEPQIIYECGDSATNLKKYQHIPFDLIITSPPYNLGKEYEDKKSIGEYLSEQEDLISQLVSMMSEQGSICWQVGNWVDPKTKEIYPLDIYYYQMFKDNDLLLRNRIIWRFGHGLHASNRFSGRYETILWFTRSNYIFNLDRVRIPSKYPGKRHHKGANKGKLSGNPKGKNPSDIWDILLKDWEQEIWEIPNVKANHREKTEHPCQYPIELIERCVLALTNEDSWILDPFAGVGSTLLAAYMHGRNAVGIELYQKYIDIGKQRLSDLKEGKMMHREMTKPIYDHTKSPLSIMPEEFKNHENNR